MSLANTYLSEYGVFDGHNDLPMTITYYDGSFDQNLKKIDLNIDSEKLAQTSVPKAKEGKLRAQFWSVYWDCASNYKDGIQWAMEQIDVIKRMVNQYDHFELVYTADDAERIATEKGSSKVASTMGRNNHS